ncbi:hypothetical protein SK355_00860 [Candidatus Fukatsuia symbiotica]|uniref:Uncharacterized protein n=2 Tax=Enterobacterales TaxID=91347 RepID=A0A2U8I7L6_9GAMM|nr:MULTISPECIES: hypothetical protein [Enterobacterales]AWK15097.1 hypothetical protein CCS41_12455 [Candidatus Fukatsuia symbiotica]MEA9443910.1 hypothetical protein [Candidatus Fukatsuia symbiotica]GFN46412.1 hypothetical protein RINTU1_20160 [Candidatus Regiella insecticola]
MKQPLQRRLDELKQAFAQGQTVFNELKEKQANTHDTLLRLQGAIQVLEEILTQEPVSDEAEKALHPSPKDDN